MADGVKKVIIFWVLSLFLCISSCSDSEKQVSNSFLIKTELLAISDVEFLEELELKKIAYPYDLKKDPKGYNEVVISLVKILSEELVLLSAAAGKNITVSDQEVSTAETEFKKDYPDDSFEQVLLESAVSYSVWKKRFKKNMIIEKLIDQELKQKIEITPEDIVHFYKSHVQGKADSEGKSTLLNRIENEKQLVARLRLIKTQENYDEWIKKQFAAYPVDINEDKLKQFLIEVKPKKDGYRKKS